MVIKPIPAPVQEPEPLVKVKKAFFNTHSHTETTTPVKPAHHKVVVIKHEEPVLPKIEDPVVQPKDEVVFPTIESLGLEVKPKTVRNKKRIVICILEIGIGIALTVFSAGSFYNTIMRSFGTGIEFLYVYQIGTVVLVGGMITIYDGIKRVRQV